MKDEIKVTINFHGSKIYGKDWILINNKILELVKENVIKSEDITIINADIIGGRYPIRYEDDNNPIVFKLNA